MATVPAAPLVLLPIVVLIEDPADTRLGHPVRAEVRATAQRHVAGKAEELVKRGTQFIAITRSRDTMVRGPEARAKMARVRMVHVLQAPARMARARGASPLHMVAHRVASFSRARRGMGRPRVALHRLDGFRLRPGVIVNPRVLGLRLIRRRARSGCTATMPWPPRWPIRTAGCAACC